MTETQSCPGILQLAHGLAAGIAAESVAYAEFGRALNTYGDHMSSFAQKQYTEGEQMVKIADILTIVQWVTGILAVVTMGAGAAVGVAVSGAAGTATTVSTAVDVTTQTAQGVTSMVQGGMQAYKSQLIGKTEMDSTAVAAFSKTSKNDTDTIKEESKGAGKLGFAIDMMLINEGAITRQKIT